MPSPQTPKKRTIKWGDIGKKQIKEYEDRKTSLLSKRKCYRKWQYSDLPSYKKLLCSGRMKLESFERASRFLFEQGGVKLGHMQKKLYDVVLIAYLRKMFGEDLVGNLDYLSKKFLIDELNDAVAILFRMYFLY